VPCRIGTPWCWCAQRSQGGDRHRPPDRHCHTERHGRSAARGGQSLRRFRSGRLCRWCAQCSRGRDRHRPPDRHRPTGRQGRSAARGGQSQGGLGARDPVFGLLSVAGAATATVSSSVTALDGRGAALEGGDVSAGNLPTEGRRVAVQRPWLDFNSPPMETGMSCHPKGRCVTKQRRTGRVQLR
jgi:hypothetical protein